MSKEPRIIDGADRRKNRIMDMLQFIHDAQGVTTIEIQTRMLVLHGLTHKTTLRYMVECGDGKLIERKGIQWYTTNTYKRMLSYLYR